MKYSKYLSFSFHITVRGRFLLREVKYVFGIKPINLIEENNKIFYCNSTDTTTYDEKNCFSHGLTDCSIQQGSWVRGDVLVDTPSPAYLINYLTRSFYIVTSNGVSYLKVKHIFLIFFQYLIAFGEFFMWKLVQFFYIHTPAVSDGKSIYVHSHWRGGFCNTRQ